MGRYLTKSKQLLNELDPPIAYDERSIADYLVLRLSVANNADYEFALYFYAERDDGEEPQICASPIKALENTSFWCYSFEIDDFESDEARLEVYLSTLSKLLTNESRIIQRRGMFFWAFDCELLLNNAWTSLYPIVVSRWGARVLPVKGRERIYHSPPLSSRRN